jgi:Co/Zn/Cd efflux system component
MLDVMSNASGVHHDHGHDREHGHGHDHDHGGHGHSHGAGVLARVLHVVRPHSHEASDKVDAAMEASAAGMRALWISLGVLGATAVALLGDTLHNAADTLTAVPLGIAFVVGRRPATRRYTYGYGRAEDLAGVAIVVLILASSALAAYEAASRLVHPQRVSDLIAVAAAALVGFAGNELVARYRIRSRTGCTLGRTGLPRWPSCWGRAAWRSAGTGPIPSWAW